MEDIDYSQKIATFNLLVGNMNEEIALNYLTISNWDENKAAILYNRENKGAQATLQRPIIIPPNLNDNFIHNTNIYNTNIKPVYQSNINKNYGNRPNSAREPQIKKEIINSHLLAKLNKYKQCKIYKRGFFDSFKFYKRDNKDYCRQFSISCKYCVQLYDVFIKTLKNRVGIILLYNDRAYNDAIDFLDAIKKNDVTQNILSSKTMVMPLVSGCLEGDSLIKEMNIKDFPCLIICLYKNAEHLAVIGIINNIMQNIRMFNEKVIEALEIINDESNSNNNKYYNNVIPVLPENKIRNDFKNNNNTNVNYFPNNNKNISKNTNNINIPKNNNINNNIINNNKENNNIINNTNNNNINIKENKNQNIINDINNYLPEDINGLKRDSFPYIEGVRKDSFPYNEGMRRDSYTYMTDGEILARQEQEMKKLEKMEENKKLEEEKKEREKKEEEEKKKEMEILEKIQAKSALEKLPEEPSDDNPDKCVIVFRFPDGEKVVQRKFLKTDKITNLYLYIKSFGREIYTEEEGSKFSLVQPFPPKNFDELQENSLEKEGLFPNAVLQIRVAE